jgi:hypothetical protein
MTAEVEKRYKGTGDPGEFEAARDAYYKAFGNALRPIAEEAKTPELKAAIMNVADAYSRGCGRLGGWVDPEVRSGGVGEVAVRPSR